MVKRLTKLNTKAITNTLDDWFIDMGKPERLRSDGGPQFRSEFDAWAKKEDIVHELSSPYNHQSNGHAEVAVREMKHLLAKTKNWQKFRLALREYRNTPRFDGLSPAQWLTGRRQRTSAIATLEAYKKITEEQFKSHMDRRGREYTKVKERADGSKRELEQLHPGDKIWLQDPKTKRWTTEGTIINARSERSYWVTDGARDFIRNRRFIKPSRQSTGSTINA